MAATYLSLSNLRPALEQGALVLVPNNRLRNHLLRAYALQQTAKAWVKPNIQSLSQWLENQWKQLQDDGWSEACCIIASPLQRQMLWEKAIAQSVLGANLLQPQPLALQADAALRNLELWRLSAADVAEGNAFVDPGSNSTQFIGWLKTFTADLERQGAITHESSIALIARSFTEGHLARLPEIYLEGFDDLPPLTQYLLASASDRVITLPNQIASSTHLLRTQANTTEEEIRAAAHWSKIQLEQQPETALIGIVVPNLGQCRDQVERIFTEVFEPGACLPVAPRYTLPFNFSAGIPLGRTPLIHSLFEVLSLNTNNWPLERLCNFLHSPFWGDADNELIARTHLSTRLRELGRLTLGPGDVRFNMDRLEQQIPQLARLGISQRFERISTLLRRVQGHKSARAWLLIFDEILGIAGWPGTRRLDSQEYQQLNQWFEVRDQFASIDSHCAPVSYAQACRYLRQLADKTPFQAQTPDSPIQILGALEAAGLQFSHLWVLGLSDNQWPASPSPNPLLPLNLQRLHKLPHSSAERELEIARGLTERYRQSAPTVIFSSAHTDGDNELRASALIRDLPLTSLNDLIPNTATGLRHYYQILLNQQALEIINDAQGPLLQEGEPVRGGSNLFKLQAACPFSAFAQLRLGARNPDEPAMGFSPIERGNLLHDSLALIWRELGNSQRLKALSSIELQTLVRNITAAVINSAQQYDPQRLGKVYCELEQERLGKVLCDWLDNERERPEFTVIAIEREDTIQFANLTLTLRIDRIDQFTNGDRLLIDYKTGNASSKGWQGERPGEPQLPLYAVTAKPDETIAAISFAIINRKQQSWDGLGELHDTSLHQAGIKVSDNWNLQLLEWQTLLQSLANDFMSGDARVDFKDKQAQDYATDLLPLHRLADADALAALAAHKEQADGSL